MMAGERMRLAMAHLAHTATQLESDVNAGYIDYDDYDDRRGCRPVDSSDEDEADVDLTEFVEDEEELQPEEMMATDPAPPISTGASFSKFESDLDAQFSRLKAQMYGLDEEPPASEVPGSAAEPEDKKPETTPTAPDFYDDDYFDSDDGESGEPHTASDGVGMDPSAAPSGGTKGARRAKRHAKRPVLSNDALFYDPDIDEDNQRWVDKQRDLKGRNPFDEFGEDISGGSGAAGRASAESGPAAAAAAHNAKRGMAPAPASDAVLNCSACMSTLCLDCQRHDTYPDQFRAMFVHNCHVDRTETLVFRKKDKKGNHKRRFKTKDGREKGPQPDEEFHPVVCGECNAVVAVYDCDEIYHFFDVIASLP